MSSAFKSHIQTKIAGGTITQYTAVKYTSDNKTVVAAGAGDHAIGIAQSAGNTGDEIEVAMPGGGALWLAGGSIGLGMKQCKSDSSGKAVIASDTDWVVANVDSGSQVAGDVCACFVQPGYAGAAES